MTRLEWMARSVALECRVCGYSGRGTDELGFDTESGPATGTRCPDCGSLQLLDEILASTPDDASVDDYLWSGAGVGEFADLIARLPARPGARMLDVGCGYGLALDYARWARGWSVRGVDPSYAAVRGARELGIDIHHGPLTPDLDLGDPFDVVFCSEVLEHVTDPSALLAQLRARVRDDGILVLTTPDAAVVNRDSPDGDVVSALSPGYHVVLPSRSGLDGLLRRAGFESVRFGRSRVSHLVVARSSPGDLPTLSDPGPDLRLDAYFTERGRALAGSVPGLAMAVRALRQLVAEGRFREARRAERSVRRGMDQVFGADVRRPGAAHWPAALAGAPFALGMMELLDGSAEAALGRFDEAIAAGRAADGGQVRADDRPVDSDLADVALQSRYHRLLALARVRPDATARDCAEFLTDAQAEGVAPTRRRVWALRVFVELAARGAHDAARPLVPEVERILDATVGDDDGELGRARADAAICLRAMGLLADDEPAVEAELELGLDSYWCDSDGTFLAGWVHRGGDPGTALAVRMHGRETPARRTRRDDLAARWPDAPDVADSGFEVLLPGPPVRDVEVRLTTSEGRLAHRLHLPASRRPESVPDDDDLQPVRTAVAAAPEGPVLLLGARRSGTDIHPGVRDLIGDREVVGLDIHPGNGVDIVADAHRLSEVLDRGAFPVVVSASLLEHVAQPWTVCREVVDVLPVGGVAVHQVPWVWPTHSSPNDFWRISPEGLRELHPADFGVDVVAAGRHSPAAVVPLGDWRGHHGAMPTLASGAFSWIVVRRVADAAVDATWPYDPESGRETAERYPLDGIIPEAKE